MRLGRKRTLRGKMMKAVFKYLKGYHMREGKIILICLKRTKPGLTKRSYRAGLGSPSRGIQYKLQWILQGNVTPPHPLLLPYQQVEASDRCPETESQIPALRGSWPRKPLRSHPSLSLIQGFHTSWERQKRKLHFHVALWWQTTESTQTSQSEVKEQAYYITVWRITFFPTGRVWNPFL